MLKSKQMNIRLYYQRSILYNIRNTFSHWISKTPTLSIIKTLVRGQLKYNFNTIPNSYHKVIGN